MPLPDSIETLHDRQAELPSPTSITIASILTGSPVPTAFSAFHSKASESSQSSVESLIPPATRDADALGIALVQQRGALWKVC